MRILLTDEARGDLDKIPERLRAKVLRKISYLNDFPLMGVKMEDAFRGFRSLLAGGKHYRVIYRIRERDLVIYYIRHTARQIGLRVVHAS